MAKKNVSKVPEGHVDLHISLPIELRDKVSTLGTSDDPTSLALRGLSFPKRFAYLIGTHPLIAKGS